MDLTVFHVDRGTLLDEIERNAQLKQMRLWAKVRHVGPLVYIDEETGEPYEEIVTKESITDPSFVNGMLFLPVTDDHPSEFVNEKNRAALMKGVTGTQPAVDEDGFLIDFAIYDEELMDKISAGKRDVSLGYKSVIRVDSENKRYQIKCVPNHLAIVDEGRAPKASIIYSVRGDSIFWQPSKLSKPETQERRDMKTVSIDGRNFDVDDSLADAIDGLGKKYMDMKSMYDAMKSMYDALKAEYDGMMPKLNKADAKIDELQDRLKTLSDEKAYFDKAQKEILARYRVIDAARQFGLKEKYDPATDSLVLTKQFIKEVRPNRDLEGKSADYISASFDSILEYLEELEKQEEEIILQEEEEEEENTTDSLYRAAKKAFPKKDSRVEKANKAYAQYKEQLEASYASDFRN